MPAVIQLTSNAEEIARRMHGLPPRINQAIRRRVAGALKIIETKVRERRGVQARRGAAGLYGRLTSYARLNGNQLEGAIGFRNRRLFPYELSHEFGANAHKGAMTVPVSGEAKAASERGIGARAFGRDLFLLKLGGRALLCETVGHKLIVHYVLIKSLPARLGFRETVMQYAPSEISAAIVAGFNEGKKQT
jgi:hypothetical protein